jgi:class 3 adenylate cyclase
MARTLYFNARPFTRAAPQPFANGGSSYPHERFPTTNTISTAHRQVAVMFSDLVGSPRMDPEDLREAISAHQRCVAERPCIASAGSSRST